MEGNAGNNLSGTDFGKKMLALAKAGFKVADLVADHVLRERLKVRTLAIYEEFFGVEKKSVLDGKNHLKLLEEIDALDQVLVLGGHLNLIKNEHLNPLRNGLLVFKSRVVLAVDEKKRGPVSALEIPPVSTPAIQAVSLKKGSKQKKKIEEKDKERKTEELNDRQIAILEYFVKNKTKQINWEEIIKFLPFPKERTIRRDIQILVNQKKIKKLFKGTYILN